MLPSKSKDAKVASTARILRRIIALILVATALLLALSAVLHTSPKTAAARVLHPTPAATSAAPETRTPDEVLLGPIACEDGEAAGYECYNVDLLAHLPLSTFAASSASDLWGWQDPETGKAYALLGVNDGTAFVDVSQPARPVYLGKLPSHGEPNLWHDIKVYANYALAISEAAGHGMQIFDLRQLRDVGSPPVTFRATAHYGEFGSAHNLAVNAESGFAYAVGAEQGRACAGGLHMIDIGDPTNPSFAGCYTAEGTIHDTQCVMYQGPDADYQGRELCFNSSVNAFTIVDVSDKSQPRQIASMDYPGLAYAHQGRLTADQRYFLLNDEFDEINYGTNTRIYTWDVTDLDRPTMTGIHRGPSQATSHNLYLDDGYVYAANYTQGLRVLRPVSLAEGEMERVAHFDTYIRHDQSGYHHGAWTAYPFFEDQVLVSSIDQGLFVLRPNLPEG